MALLQSCSTSPPSHLEMDGPRGKTPKGETVNGPPYCLECHQSVRAKSGHPAYAFPLLLHLICCLGTFKDV